FRERVGLGGIDAFASGFCAFSDCHGRYPFTSRPIERAEPSTIFMAASMVLQFKSFILAAAISLTCALVTEPAMSRQGVLEPLSSLAAFLRECDIGGVLSS